MDSPEDKPARKVRGIVIRNVRSLPIKPGQRSTASIQREVEARAARRRRWLIGAALVGTVLMILGAGILIGRFWL
jgi:hypothetical protein